MFKPIGFTLPLSLEMVTANEAVVAGRLYAAAGVVTAATTVARPTHIGIESHDAKTTQQVVSFGQLQYDREYLADVKDGNSDCFYKSPSASGNANGTTIVDTVNRLEDNDYWNYGIVILHGVSDGNKYPGGVCQMRKVTDFVNATGTITVSPAFCDEDGTAIQITPAHKYTILNFRSGLNTISIDSTGDYVLAESTITASGYLEAVGLPDASNAINGLVKQRVKIRQAAS